MTIPDQSVLAILSREELKTFVEALVDLRSRELDRPAAPERLEMSSAVVERGELLGTIPLVPGETTAVEH
ncbi:hypothetical protein [Lapillicoccus sp.]|uniref:hypothetical protein n=1 Tax=Lapillicoccus sp. TaxID=1909287 RepID=UPI003982E4C2